VGGGEEGGKGRLVACGCLSIHYTSTVTQNHKTTKHTQNNRPHLLLLIRPPQALRQEHVALLGDGLLVSRFALCPPEEVAWGDEACVFWCVFWLGCVCVCEEEEDYSRRRFDSIRCDAIPAYAHTHIPNAPSTPPLIDDYTYPPAPQRPPSACGAPGGPPSPSPAACSGRAPSRRARAGSAPFPGWGWGRCRARGSGCGRRGRGACGPRRRPPGGFVSRRGGRRGGA
jgi:hypothetical protein